MNRSQPSPPATGRTSTQRPAWPRAGLLWLALGAATPGAWAAAGDGTASASASAAATTAASAGTSAAAQAAPPVESLGAMVARVLAQDPAVRVQGHLLQASDERRQQAGSRMWPTIGLSSSRGSANVSEESLFGSATPFERRTDRTEATVRWNLYNYGNDGAELRGAARDLAAATEELRRAREETAERIAEVYADLLRVQQIVPRSAQRLAAVRRLVQQVGRQNEAGKVSDADLQQAQASLLDAEVVHEQWLADLSSARERLAAVTGSEMREAVPVQLPAAAATVEPGNGQVNAARERAQAARERVRPVISLAAPKVDVEYRHRLSDRTTPASTTTERYGWTLSARWDIPVGGESMARRNEGERRAEAAAAEAERVQRAAMTELVTLPPRMAQATQAMAQIERQIEQYNTLVRAGELQFEAGRRTLPQLVQLHDSRFAAEQRRVEQSHRLLQARLRQLSLSGGLLPALNLEN
ncbi:TolC family protein [Aquabacterium sp. OR-4]|uniref:TolC family protein n=1 Tax=Aquabacterium sp. OR-4 TaxID=2978127 RepID=UPI0028C9C337|nr:TolC family protein [Aquabacterium sp. OR-4]MDT7837380.1 TolC family protein [Aquabacterium sp. OR-4]